MSSRSTTKRTGRRREEILAEATKLFAERGYEGTSMGDLAECVGLRKASLFHHFASKEELYTAVLAHPVEAVRTSIAKAAILSGSFTERLDVLTDMLTVGLCEQPYAARLLLREVMDWGPVVREHLAEQMTGVLVTAAAFVRAGQEEGTFADVEPRQLILTLIGLHFMPFAVSGLVTSLTGHGPGSAEFLQARRAAVRDQVRRLMLAQRP